MHASSLVANFRATCTWLNLSVTGLSEPQLLQVPLNFRNNILWNIGHLIVDNCDMLYAPCGLESPHPEAWTGLFRAGSSPSDWPRAPDVQAVLEGSKSLTERIIGDYQSGRFGGFDPAKVKTGWPMKDLDQTLAYVTIHEAVHLGMILSMRKSVT